MKLAMGASLRAADDSDGDPLSPLCGHRSHRQGEGNDGATLAPIRRLDGALMGDHQLAGDGQPQAGAAVYAGPPAIGAVEAIEDVRERVL